MHRIQIYPCDQNYHVLVLLQWVWFWKSESTMMGSNLSGLSFIILRLLLFRPHLMRGLQKTSNRATTFFKTSKCHKILALDHVYPWLGDERVMADGLAGESAGPFWVTPSLCPMIAGGTSRCCARLHLWTQHWGSGMMRSMCFKCRPSKTKGLKESRCREVLVPPASPSVKTTSPSKKSGCGSSFKVLSLSFPLERMGGEAYKTKQPLLTSDLERSIWGAQNYTITLFLNFQEGLG